MKKLFILILALVLCFGTLSACANNGGGETTAETAPIPDDGVLRVLIIGHSLGNNSTWLLPEIAKNEGYENTMVGMLYYSACRLGQHVQFINTNAAEYEYRKFDLSSDVTWQIADANGSYRDGGYGAELSGKNIKQTMRFALRDQDWDVVVLQAGVFEATGKKTTDSELNLDHIQQIMDYVKKNDIDKSTPIRFGWNMTWACPENLEKNDEAYWGHMRSAFENSQQMYEAIAATVKDEISVKYQFDYIMPAGTAFQNAHSSYMGDSLYRDYIHGNDFACLVAAYTWLCTLTGKDMSQMKIEPIDSHHLISYEKRTNNIDWVLNETEKNILIESVTNALKTPYAMTQSAYTEKPAQ